MPYIGNIPPSEFRTIDYQDFTGVTGNPVKRGFTLTSPVGSANDLEIFVNNVRQEPTTAYSVSDTTVTLTGSVVATDDIYVVYNGLALQTIVPPDGSVSTAKIADDAVTNAKIADDAVVTASIADDAVTLAKAADSLYRTGTWTPVIVSGSGSYNGLTTSGTFTRIGNTVHVTARILITASGNASGSMNINNLPFNGYTPAGVRQMIQGRENAQNGYMIQVLINSGTTLGKMQFYDGANCTHTTNYEYIVTGTYQTNDA